MLTQELPERVSFFGSEVDDDRALYLLQSSVTAQGAPSGDLSTPIFFYPDGTTSNARLVVANERGRYILLTLRGLTGVVRVSGMLTASQLE